MLPTSTRSNSLQGTISMTIYKPTWLYIKQHNVTGLKYFGKTTQKNPVKYKGSGVRWSNHLKKYGEDVTTIWVQLFEDKQQLTEYAIKFSKDNNIVESQDWANLKIEDGLSGGRDSKHSEESKLKMSEARKRQVFSKETKKKMSDSKKGKRSPTYGMKFPNRPSVSKETREKLSEVHKGIPKERFLCPHCNREIAGASNAKRWHFDNCRLC